MIRALLTRLLHWWRPEPEFAPELPKTLTDFRSFRANAESTLYLNWERRRHG